MALTGGDIEHMSCDQLSIGGIARILASSLDGVLHAPSAGRRRALDFTAAMHTTHTNNSVSASKRNKTVSSSNTCRNFQVAKAGIFAKVSTKATFIAL